MNQIKKIKHISFILTHKCNLNCIYCLRQAGSDKPEMDLETIKNIINTVEFENSKSCMLTGGEAALHSKFWDVVSLLGKQKFSVCIESNGFIINKQWIDRLLEKIDKSRLSFLISLDHYDEQIHDAFRGKGTFERAKEATKLLKNKGITVKINAVIHKKNFFSRLELYNFLNFLCELKISKIHFSPVVSVGNNQDARYSLTGYEIVSLEEIIGEAKSLFHDRIKVINFNNNSGVTCGRINDKNIVVSHKGFHPCLYLDDIVVKNLKDGMRENYHYNKSLRYLKKAVDINQENNTDACRSCCQAFQEFYADPPFHIQTGD